MSELEDETDTSSDVAPPAMIQTLSLLWIVLFGGRWVVISLLQWNGVLSPEQVSGFDAGVLSRVYLILLALTILIVALRGTRRFSSGVSAAAPPSISSKQRGSAPSAPVPASRQEHRKP